MPRAWVVSRRVWVALFTCSMGLVVLLPLMHSETGEPLRSYGVLSVQSWLLLSIASMLFLMPHTTRDVIVCSQQELRAWQFKSFTGSLIIGISSFLCASHLAVTMSDWVFAVFCGITILSLLFSPWFFRLCTWRIWVGMALVFMSRV